MTPEPETRTTSTPLTGQRRTRRGPALAITLAAGLLVAPAAAWALPTRLPAFQDTAVTAGATASEVVAQGIARLPNGQLVWTVRHADAPGGSGAAVSEFPIGFVIADGGTMTLLDKKGQPLQLLSDGEAAFLPGGDSGAYISQGNKPTNFYEVGVVPAQKISGDQSSNVVGNPFAAPTGDAFDIELARAVLANGEQASIPAALSGAPTLFLVTSGTVQLQAGDQVVNLDAGQNALLNGAVVVSGASDQPATFVTAAIGEATTAKAETAGTPTAKAAKAKKAKGTGGGGGGGGGGNTDGDEGEGDSDVLVVAGLGADGGDPVSKKMRTVARTIASSTAASARILRVRLCRVGTATAKVADVGSGSASTKVGGRTE